MYISRFSQKSVPLPAVLYDCESWFPKFKASLNEGTEFWVFTVLSFIKLAGVTGKKIDKICIKDNSGKMECRINNGIPF